MEHEIGYIFQPLQIDNIFSIEKHDDLFCHSKKEILSIKLWKKNWEKLDSKRMLTTLRAGLLYL